MDGFFEWDQKRAAGKVTKQPYFIYCSGAREHEDFGGKKTNTSTTSSISSALNQEPPPIMFCAGLYDVWINSEGEKVYSYTIITTSANKSFKWLHDRLPVMLTKSEIDTWLFSNVSDVYLDLLKPSSDSSTVLAWHPVTPRSKFCSIILVVVTYML